MRGSNVGKTAVVVVEDNPLNMKLMGDILGIAGLTMIGRPDGSGLIDVVAEADPLVVLMDIQLPGLSGVDLRHMLAGDPRTAAVPVYAVTANVDPESLRTYEAARFGRVFAKPVSIASLLAALKDLRAPASAN